MGLTEQATTGSLIGEVGRPRHTGEQAADALPLGARSPMQDAEACRERILPRQYPKRDGNLPTATHTQLRAQRVRMRLRCPGRDTEPLADLVVRAPCRDQRNDFTLPRCQARLSLERLSDHDAGG
jgi:hypothetical protein